MPALVMGVLNVTPDSFSDGGRYLDHEAAVARGLEMQAEGAAVVDVGGESSRPGAGPVTAVEERRRVLPVVEALAPHGRISIDTAKASVAEPALAAGATLVNDITASLAEVAAAGGAGWVAMHMQGAPPDMQSKPHYTDVVAEVRHFLVARAERALALGVTEVWIDPGIGFGKWPRHNLSLLRHLPKLVACGHPVLVGTSRKGFLGSMDPARAAPAPVQDRTEESLATAVWAMSAGVGMVRVHDVAGTVQAAQVVGCTSGERC